MRGVLGLVDICCCCFVSFKANCCVDVVIRMDILPSDSFCCCRLKSGDIGQWNPNGTLSIIDRKKNIFKLQQGEYVAPEHVEGVYLESSLISQIFVYGDSLEARLVAIVIPDDEFSMLYAKENGITVDTLEDLCYDPSFKEAVMFDMKTFAAKAHLKGFETCADISLSTHSFTIENGLLTPTYKLKRAMAYKVFQREIADMYSKLH